MLMLLVQGLQLATPLVDICVLHPTMSFWMMGPILFMFESSQLSRAPGIPGTQRNSILVVFGLTKLSSSLEVNHFHYHTIKRKLSPKRRPDIAGSEKKWLSARLMSCGLPYAS